MKTSQKGKYRSILATEGHNPVTKLSQFYRFNRFEMGFYLGDKVIGGGALKRVQYVPKKNTCLQTEGVSLNKAFRRKGHGIHLYLHLIRHAKSCGAERIYSSRYLNQFSRRMWSEKLSKIFEMKEVRKKCGECGCRCKATKAIGYYIQLKEGGR